MTATVELTTKDAADLEELFNDILERDAAVERFVNGQQKPGDILLLRKYGLLSDQAIRHEYNERIRGIRYRSPLAGTPKEYAAAQKRVTDADAAAAKAKGQLEPQIEAAREKVAKLERELKQFADEQTESKNALGVMEASRDVLRGSLLPPELRSLQEVVQRQAYAKFAPRVRDIREQISALHIHENSRRQDLERQMKDLEAEIKAATPTKYVDIYLPLDA